MKRLLLALALAFTISAHATDINTYGRCGDNAYYTLVGFDVGDKVIASSDGWDSTFICTASSKYVIVPHAALGSFLKYQYQHGSKLSKTFNVQSSVVQVCTTLPIAIATPTARRIDTYNVEITLEVTQSSGPTSVRFLLKGESSYQPFGYMFPTGTLPGKYVFRATYIKDRWYLMSNPKLL